VKSLAQLYAAQHGVPLDEVEREIFLRSLYPHARWLQPLIDWVAPLNFAADVDMVSEVAQLTDMSEFSLEVYAHQHHPAAGSIARRFFLLRLSVGRLHRLSWSAFHSGEEMALSNRAWRHRAFD
jgi:hypothetical protein